MEHKEDLNIKYTTYRKQIEEGRIQYKNNRSIPYEYNKYLFRMLYDNLRGDIFCLNHNNLKLFRYIRGIIEQIKCIKCKDTYNFGLSDDTCDLCITRPSTPSTCNIPGCNQIQNGLFAECKPHFDIRHKSSSNYEWNTPEKCYETAIRIFSCYKNILDYSQIKKEDFISRGKSRITIKCLLCGIQLCGPLVEFLYGAKKCKGCSGCKWTLITVKNRLKYRTDLNLDEVTESHIMGHCSHIPVTCNSCGCKWYPTINDLINSESGCPNCAHTAPWTFLKVKDKLKNRPEINSDKVREEHINKGVDSQLPLSCNICFYEWSTSINNLFNSKSGCPDCGGKVLWTFLRVKDKLKNRPEINSDKVREEHINEGKDSRLPLSCNICSYEWSPSIKNLFNRLSGCPYCKSSKAIKMIVDFLKIKNIHCIPEKTFEGLEYISSLQIDVFIFSIPGIKFPICIEYDGNYPGSHFSYRNDKEKIRHMESVKRDIIKDHYCPYNNIHLIRIPYTCFINNNENLLIAILDASFETLIGLEKPIVHLADITPYYERNQRLGKEFEVAI